MRAHKIDQPLKIRCHRFLAPQPPWSALNNPALSVAVPSEGETRDFDLAKCPLWVSSGIAPHLVNVRFTPESRHARSLPCAKRRIEGQQHHRDLSDAGSNGDRFFQRADMMDTKVGADKKDVHNKMQAAWK
jgi:hypothetical protein